MNKNDEIRIANVRNGLVRVDLPPTRRFSHWAIFFEKKGNRVEYTGFSYTYDDNPTRIEPPEEAVAKAKKAAEEWLLSSRSSSRSHQPRLF